MTSRDDLLAALMVERFDNRWWTTAPTTQAPDDDLTCARRRREMVADFEALVEGERKAR